MATVVAFAGPIWARPTAVRRDFLPAWSPHLALPPWPARVQGWWPKSSHTHKPDWPKNGSKRPSSGSTGLGAFFSGFRAEMSVLGLGTLFGMQN